MRNPLRQPLTPERQFKDYRRRVRLLGLLAIATGAYYLSTLMPEGVNAAATADTSNTLLIGAIALGMLSLMGTWFFDFGGGMVAILSGLGAGKLAYDRAGGGQFLDAFMYGSPFVIGGILALVVWRRRRQFRVKEVAEKPAKAKE